MDFRLFRNKDELNSTCFFEIGPGKYSQKHWQDGFAFVEEDAFGFAEGILAKHLPDYDHFGMNELPRAVGVAVAAEWRKAAETLPNLTPQDAAQALLIDSAFRTGLEPELAGRRKEIQALLTELADELERLYRQAEWVCVLGI